MMLLVETITFYYNFKLIKYIEIDNFEQKIVENDAKLKPHWNVNKKIYIFVKVFPKNYVVLLQTFSIFS